MSDTFDWAGLAGSIVLANAGQGPDAAIAILQREIEAAFVPVERYENLNSVEQWLIDNPPLTNAALVARAEAAEARVEALTAQLAEARESERAALIEGAGELERLGMSGIWMASDPEGAYVRYDQAAATIAAQKAEIERLTEREAQAKLDGVKAGIEASAGALEADAKLCDCFARSEGECACGAWSDYKTVPMERAVDVVRALDAEAIAKGIITADALSDLIAGDADLIAPDTLADSDGDDGA